MSTPRTLGLTLLASLSLTACFGQSSDKPEPPTDITCYAPDSSVAYKGQSVSRVGVNQANTYFTDTQGNKVDMTTPCLSIRPPVNPPVAPDASEQLTGVTCYAPNGSVIYKGQTSISRANVANTYFTDVDGNYVDATVPCMSVKPPRKN